MVQLRHDFYLFIHQEHFIFIFTKLLFINDLHSRKASTVFPGLGQEDFTESSLTQEMFEIVGLVDVHPGEDIDVAQQLVLTLTDRRPPGLCPTGGLGLFAAVEAGVGALPAGAPHVGQVGRQFVGPGRGPGQEVGEGRHLVEAG